MNENSYDIVFVDADPGSVIEYVEHGLRLARPGGLVLVAHALWHGRVANPAARDATTTGFRTLLTEVSTSPAVISSLSTAGDGCSLVRLTSSGVAPGPCIGRRAADAGTRRTPRASRVRRAVSGAVQEAGLRRRRRARRAALWPRRR